MASPKSSVSPTGPSKIVSRLGAMILSSTLLALGLVVVPGSRESFRAPKEAVLILGGSLLLPLLALSWRRAVLPRTFRASLVAWFVVYVLSATFSSDPILSLAFSLPLAACAVLFFASASFASTTGVTTLRILLIAPLLNAAIGVTQALGVSSVFAFAKVEHRLTITGFLGNPGDLGAYLVPWFLLSLALLAAGTRRARFASAAAAAALGIALILAQSVTSMLASTTGLAFMAFRLPTARRWVGRGALLLVFSGTLLAMSPFGLRYLHAIQALMNGDVLMLTSGRPLAYLAAWHMFLDNPVLGVGPQRFGWNYFDYQIAVKGTYSWLRDSQWTQFMFAQAHSDLLEILAETGALGLASFFGVVAAFVAAFVRRPIAPSTGAEEVVARTVALPVCAALLVQMAGHFPLHLAAVAASYAFIVGFSLGRIHR